MSLEMTSPLSLKPEYFFSFTVSDQRNSRVFTPMGRSRWAHEYIMSCMLASCAAWSGTSVHSSRVCEKIASLGLLGENLPNPFIAGLPEYEL